MRHDFRFASIALAAAIVGAAFVAPSLAAQDASATVRATADSSFTDAQAERGASVFTRVCLECHAREDMSNPDFKGKWSGQTTFDLFKNISTTMPDNNPGMLARTEYTDVVAYILKLNGVPAGSAELAPDSAVMSAAKMNLPAAANGAGFARAVRRASDRAFVANAHARLFARPPRASAGR